MRCDCCNQENINCQCIQDPETFVKKFTYQFDMNSGRYILINTNNTLSNELKDENIVGIDIMNKVVYVDVYSVYQDDELAKNTVIKYANQFNNDITDFLKKLN